MISTTIRQFRTNIPYSLSLLYLQETHQYAVIFASQSKNTPGEVIRTFDQYLDAWKCYEQNWRYYRADKPVPATEEEFHGLPKGTLYPCASV